MTTSPKRYYQMYVSLRDLQNLVNEVTDRYLDPHDPEHDLQVIVGLSPDGHITYSRGRIEEVTDEPAVTVTNPEWGDDGVHVVAGEEFEGDVYPTEEGAQK